MGHKIHPYGFRVGITKPHLAQWFDVRKNVYRDFVLKDVKIRELVKESLRSAGIDKVEIVREPRKTIVTVYVARVGVAVGKEGSNIQKLREKLQKIEGEERKLEIRVRDIKQISLSASAIAHMIARAIEKRRPVKPIVKKALESIRKTGVPGAKIQVKGRIGGSDNTLTYKRSFGRVPLQTIRADIDYAYERAMTATAGVLSVKVWIYRGEIFE